jgi:hypothetical protein
MKRLFFLIVVLLSLVACENCCKNPPPPPPQKKQMNIIILLDLSDRIDSTRYSATPEHYLRDIENIKTITKYFKSKMIPFIQAKGKIAVYCLPPPDMPNINSIISELKFDLTRKNPAEKKVVQDTIIQLYTQNLTKIYKQTNAANSWDGSDIWGFFKNDLRSCMVTDTIYRNILIIFTDGYIYHINSTHQQGNRFSYLLRSNIAPYCRNNYPQLIDQRDFGLIKTCEDLSNLEILVLEISAQNPANQFDEDVLEYLWRKWFKEMNVSRFEIYRSDLPTNTDRKIENFLN